MGFEKIVTPSPEEGGEEEDAEEASVNESARVSGGAENPVKLWRPRPHRELMPPLHFPLLPPPAPALAPPAAAHSAHGGAAAAAAAMAMAAAATPVLRQYSMFGINHHGSPFQHPKQSAVRLSSELKN